MMVTPTHTFQHYSQGSITLRILPSSANWGVAVIPVGRFVAVFSFFPLFFVSGRVTVAGIGGKMGVKPFNFLCLISTQASPSSLMNYDILTFIWRKTCEC